jgi:selenocysteine lyase/cysteine desulfurase
MSAPHFPRWWDVTRRDLGRRASCYLYTGTDDIDRLVSALHDLSRKVI